MSHSVTQEKGSQKNSGAELHLLIPSSKTTKTVLFKVLEVKFTFKSMSCYQIIKLLCCLLSSVYGFCVIERKSIFFYWQGQQKSVCLFVYIQIIDHITKDIQPSTKHTCSV